MNVLEGFWNRRRALPLYLIGVFLLMQLVPSQYGHANPPVQEEPEWDSAETRRLAEQACFDCHSNETEWFWYSYVAPVSWLLTRDVYVGRRALNFSEWDAQARQQTAAEEAVELLAKKQMPLPYYLFLHPEARLTPIEEGMLIRGLIQTLEEDRYLEHEDLNQSEEQPE